MKDYKVIEKYNFWVKGQIKIFSTTKSNCPYFLITQKIVESLNDGYRKKLSEFEKNGYSGGTGFEMYSQIFKNINYIPKTKKKAKLKSLKNIVLRIKEDSEKYLINLDSFLIHCKRIGFNPIRYHFKWVLENKIIEPAHLAKGNALFSEFQFLEYETVRKYKESSLDYPNPKILHLEKKYITGYKAVTWQEHLLLNKEIIRNTNKQYEKLIKLLDLLKRLDKSIFEELLRIKLDFRKKDKEEIDNLYNKKLSHIYSDLKYKAYKYYSDKIIKETKISKALLEYWIYSLLPAKVIKYNPLWQIANKLPIMEEIFKEEEKIGLSIFNKKNSIKIANYYVDIIRELSEFLRASYDENLINITELLSKDSFDKMLTCPICKESFLPNKERKGGRKQVLCGNPLCDRRWRAIRAKRSRAKNKK